MTRLWIRDNTQVSEIAILIPLKAVLSKLPLSKVDAWLVRKLEAQGVMPFGVTMLAFEDLSDRLAHGVLLTKDELGVFAEDNVQILDGEFVALSFQRASGRPASFKDLEAFSLRCVDGTLWECDTDDEAVIAAIRGGFAKVEEPPT